MGIARGSIIFIVDQDEPVAAAIRAAVTKNIAGNNDISSDPRSISAKYSPVFKLFFKRAAKVQAKESVMIEFCINKAPSATEEIVFWSVVFFLMIKKMLLLMTDRRLAKREHIKCQPLVLFQ